MLEGDLGPLEERQSDTGVETVYQVWQYEFISEQLFADLDGNAGADNSC